MSRRSDLNDRELLRMARKHGSISRPEIARALGVSLPTATTLVKRLMACGVLVGHGQKPSEGGRPAGLLRVNPDHLYAVGIECSLIKVEAVLVNLAGEVLSRRTTDPVDSPQPECVVEAICRMADAVIADCPDKAPGGMGVGISGLVDADEGKSVRFPGTGPLDEIPVRDSLNRRYALPVFVANDVQATTLAHLRYGIGRNVRNFIYLHIGHGIRLGIVTEGKLYEGATGKAGELGHVTVVSDGPICYCGNYGCLESLAGPPAVVAQAREAILKGVETSIAEGVMNGSTSSRFHAVLAGARSGDRLAVNLLQKAGEHIGREVGNLVNILEPELLIIGGLPPGLAEPLVEVIEGRFRGVAMPALRDNVNIELSDSEHCSCSLGAGTFVFEEFFEGTLTGTDH